ncbi:MAG: sulfur carrier protein ThiS [Phycisphaerales bacterium]
MTIVLNGESKEVPDALTVRELIEFVGMGDRACASEVNKTLVPRAKQGDLVLAEGDRVELVSLIGGG